MSRSKNYMTIEDVARELDVSRPTVYKMLNEQGLSYTRVGRLIKINRDDFDEWMYLNTTVPGVHDLKYIPISPLTLRLLCTFKDEEIASKLKAIDEYYWDRYSGKAKDIRELAKENNWSHEVCEVCFLINQMMKRNEDGDTE